MFNIGRYMLDVKHQPPYIKHQALKYETPKIKRQTLNVIAKRQTSNIIR